MGARTQADLRLQGIGPEKIPHWQNNPILCFRKTGEPQ